MTVDPTSWIKRAEDARKRALVNEDHRDGRAVLKIVEASDRLALKGASTRYVPADR
jgi:hypothetical protein